MRIDFPVSFEPSVALIKVDSLYKRYFDTATASPFDEKACLSAFFDWKAEMESVFPDLGVVPLPVKFTPGRPPEVTEEGIAEIGKALARGYWFLTY